MNTPNSDQNTNGGKSINNLKDQAINGNEIIGGDKTIAPITVLPNLNDVPDGFTIPQVINPNGDSADFAFETNLPMVDGSVNLK